ncbi:MAG: class II aldolase/adducin family protein [Anaerolineae bacterium]|nr:class II aldolase/adducin family protein [Thermoflexales bacterium]MDW8407011.1 class II aldolase/adducin family protein [Anaerolineae bacterium]
MKFQLRHTPAPPVDLSTYRELNAWRAILYRLRLIGQEADRYEGYGFGNISQRLPPFEAAPNRRCFLITGTQTGGLPELHAEHYAIVRECRPEHNLIVSEGPIKPSAESLTHGSVYALDDSARCVMHAHSPDIWQRRGQLGIPSTGDDVPYGTPEMAAEVARLFAQSDVASRRIFCMGGHEDGVVSFGRTVEEAGAVLVAWLGRALAT